MVVNGVLGAVKNCRSVKTYYITGGTGKFNINEQIYAVELGDIISAESENWLTIEGQNLKAMIITSPLFNAEDDEWKSLKLSDAE